MELAVEGTDRRQPKEPRTDLLHETVLVADLEGPPMAAPCDDRRAVGVPFERRRRTVAELEQSVKLDGEAGVLLRLGSVGGGRTHRWILYRCLIVLSVELPEVIVGVVDRSAWSA